MSDKPELKPCPFCGEIVHPVGGDVLCQNCGTFLMPYKRWNLRAPRFSAEEREAMECAWANCAAFIQGQRKQKDTARKAAAVVFGFRKYTNGPTNSARPTMPSDSERPPEPPASAA